jgi:glycine cleavage system H protein
MAHPSDRRYSGDHEWVSFDSGVATVGVSDYAQGQLGDVVYVDLPRSGDTVVAGNPFGEIESVKSVSELVAPMSGEVVEVNDALSDSPETVNADPHGDGWMIRVSVSDPAEFESLMTADRYDAFITEG